MRDEMLTTPEAAELLRAATVTLIRWRKEGRGPTFTMIGRKVFYERDVLDRWIVGQRRQPNPGPQPEAKP